MQTKPFELGLAMLMIRAISTTYGIAFVELHGVAKEAKRHGVAILQPSRAYVAVAAFCKNE